MQNLIKKIYTSAVGDIHNRMDLNPLSLEFSGNLEKEYKKYHFKYSVDFVRVALLFSIIFYLFFNILDYVVFPEKQMLFLITRFVISLLAVIIIFGISKDSIIKRNWQLAIALIVLIAGAGIIFMIVSSNKLYQHGYYTGLILILIFNYLLCRLKFVFATINGWVLFAMYLIAELVFFKIPSQNLFMYSFFLGSANFFGMAGAYFIEYQMRREFFIIQLLEKEKSNVENLNENLGQMVVERTNALEKTNLELTQKNKFLNEAKAELFKHKTDLEKIVYERTKELQEKLEELENYNELFVGREFRIKELKDKIELLENRLNNQIKPGQRTN